MIVQIRNRGELRTASGYNVSVLKVPGKLKLYCYFLSERAPRALTAALKENLILILPHPRHYCYWKEILASIYNY
jgi:hypothetical protein